VASDFRLLMVAAMYENGGNTTHRLLDGHPELAVYPFESQLGTPLVRDELSSVFPSKYRWPAFDLAGSPEEDYRLFADEEVRIRARTPHVSKFRHVPFEFSDVERGELYAELVRQHGRSVPGNVMAFFRATFAAWKDFRGPRDPAFVVGYSPVLVVDAAKLLADLPDAHVLHVVRNPWSAYADTKKRPVPLSLRHYLLGWTLNQHYALISRQRYPDRVHVVRFEDVVADPFGTLGAVCEKLGLSPAESLRQPSWNGEPLTEVYPWGTIRLASPEVNRATALELTPEERERVRMHAGPYLDAFGYGSFLEP
jgi:hypothetical protein